MTSTSGTAASFAASTSRGSLSGQNTVRSSTARPSPRSKTVIWVMSAPASPRARVTCPSAPGRSGSVSRTRTSMSSLPVNRRPLFRRIVVFALAGFSGIVGRARSQPGKGGGADDGAALLVGGREVDLGVDDPVVMPGRVVDGLADAPQAVLLLDPQQGGAARV